MNTHFRSRLHFEHVVAKASQQLDEKQVLRA